jgi:hypothetical protein
LQQKELASDMAATNADIFKRGKKAMYFIAKPILQIQMINN